MILTLSKLYDYRLEKEYDEGKHHRDERGRFASNGAEAEQVKSLSPDRQADYYEHRKAGTPHEFAMALAERKQKEA